MSDEHNKEPSLFRRISSAYARILNKIKSYINEHDSKFLIYALVAIIGITVVYLLYSLSIALLSGATLNPGLYGDQFGALNTLFTGFAFAILIVTLIMQRHELKLQREELKLQREEFIKMKDVYRKQQIDTFFFNMLEHRNSMIKNLDADDHKGLLALRRMTTLKVNSGRWPEDEVSYKENAPDIYNYFSYTTEILKYIEDFVDEENAQRYADILRASLTRTEKDFIKLCDDIATEDFKRLVQKYNINAS